MIGPSSSHMIADVSLLCQWPFMHLRAHSQYSTSMPQYRQFGWSDGSSKSCIAGSKLPATPERIAGTTGRAGQLAASDLPLAYANPRPVSSVPSAQPPTLRVGDHAAVDFSRAGSRVIKRRAPPLLTISDVRLSSVRVLQSIR